MVTNVPRSIAFYVDIVADAPAAFSSSDSPGGSLSLYFRVDNVDEVVFGELLTESGRSALEDYELDEGAPELTHIVETGRQAPGVL